MTEPDVSTRTQALHRLRSSADALAGIALKKIETELPWYNKLNAEDRSWIGVVARTGINSFTEWFEEQRSTSDATEIFNAAPRELTRSIPLQHTLALIRIVVDVAATESVKLVPDNARSLVHDAVLIYARDVAFSAAEAYARAAEQRGAWDARLEALVVDSLVRGDHDDSLHSRVAALGWRAELPVCAIVGEGSLAERALADVRRAAAKLAPNTLVGLYGSYVLVVLGAPDPLVAARRLCEQMPGRCAIGPQVEDVANAGRSVRAAEAALQALPAWNNAPAVVGASDVLPERVLAGDKQARAELVETVYNPLLEANQPLIETVQEFLSQGRSLEGAARSLFVHPNTIRYRLRRVAQTIGWDPTDPRDGFVLQIALAVGRLDTNGQH